MTRAASGARLLGDDVQHLIVWYHVLRSQLPDTTIQRLAVETLDGNLDDLTLHHVSKAAEYWQIKASVDATTPLNTTWLFTSKKGKKSLIQRIHSSWSALSAQETAKVVLATTKNIDPNDPVIACRDNNGRLADGLRHATGTLATERAAWAAHLGINESDLLTFLDDLVFRTGTNEHEWREKVEDASNAIGLRADPASIAVGVQTVRDWVKKPRREFTPAQLGSILDKLNLRAPGKRGLLVVQALDYSPRSADATVSLDFVQHFDGDEPRVRRRLVVPEKAATIWTELERARQQLRAANVQDLEVHGPMRLPLWFTVGACLGETAGFTLSARCGKFLWSTDVPIPPHATMLEPLDTSGLRDSVPWVVSVNISTDIRADVNEYSAKHLPEATVMHAFPTEGCGPLRLTSATDTRQFVLELRNALRTLRQQYRPNLVHLFLAMPGVCALFLGHVWDRLPPVQTYWDMGNPGDYEAAFLVRN